MEKRKCLAFLFCLALCSSLFQLTARAQSPSHIIHSQGNLTYSGGVRIQLYAVSEYGHLDIDPNLTPETYANLYNMCQADWGTDVVSKLAQVEQMKPSFRALLYCNMRSTTYSQNPTVYNACEANGWWLLSGGSKIVTDVGYMFDISNSAFTNWLGAYLRDRIDALGYDGLYGDNGGPSCGGGEWFYGCKVESTGASATSPWSDAQFIQYMINYQNTVKSYLETRPMCTNGIWSGERYYAHKSGFDPYLASSNIDGFMSEGGWYAYLDIGANWYTETAWVSNINFLIQVQDSWLAGHPNRFYVPLCEIGYTSLNPMPLPSGCTDEQMARYAYATVLMGLKTNQVYLGYYREVSWMNQYVLPLLNIDPGIPLNDYGMVAGTHVYARDFTNLKTLVNPSTTGYTLSLGQAYHTIEGQTITSITMAPHTGVILLSS